jgi:hypothetical protein
MSPSPRTQLFGICGQFGSTLNCGAFGSDCAPAVKAIKTSKEMVLIAGEYSVGGRVFGHFSVRANSLACAVWMAR